MLGPAWLALLASAAAPLQLFQSDAHFRGVDFSKVRPGALLSSVSAEGRPGLKGQAGLTNKSKSGEPS